MKSTISKCLLIIVILFSALGAHGEVMKATDIQTNLVGATHDNEAEAFVRLAVTLPDYSGMDPIVFENRVIAPYSRRSGSVSIDCSDIPSLLAELENIPESMKPLTIGVKLLNRKIDAKWDKKPADMLLSEIDLNVALYKKDKWKIGSQTKPALQFALKDVAVHVDEIDMSDEILTFSFSEILPETGNELFDRLLAGKIINGLVTIELIDF